MVYFTDGASRGNPGLSAHGFVQATTGYYKVGIEESATNNRAELLGVLKCLEFDSCSFDDALTIINSDSNLVVGYFMKGWKVNANIELVNQIKALIQDKYKNQGRNLVFKKVKGHTGKQDGNNAVDTMLNRAMDRHQNLEGTFIDYEVVE